MSIINNTNVNITLKLINPVDQHTVKHQLAKGETQTCHLGGPRVLVVHSSQGSWSGMVVNGDIHINSNGQKISVNIGNFTVPPIVPSPSEEQPHHLWWLLILIIVVLVLMFLYAQK